VLVGPFALYLALVDGPPVAQGFESGLRWYDAVLGLLVCRRSRIASGSLARRYADGDVHLTGEAETMLNLAVNA
jgi:hypothetical protein